MSEPIITAAELIAWQNGELKNKDQKLEALRVEITEVKRQRGVLATRLDSEVARSRPLEADAARLDKLPACFHMLRCSFGADRSQTWWLTYAPNNVYDSVRQAIDAHVEPGAQS